MLARSSSRSRCHVVPPKYSTPLARTGSASRPRRWLAGLTSASTSAKLTGVCSHIMGTYRNALPATPRPVGFSRWQPSASDSSTSFASDSGSKKPVSTVTPSRSNSVPAVGWLLPGGRRPVASYGNMTFPFAGPAPLGGSSRISRQVLAWTSGCLDAKNHALADLAQLGQLSCAQLVDKKRTHCLHVRRSARHQLCVPRIGQDGVGESSVLQICLATNQAAHLQPLHQV